MRIIIIAFLLLPASGFSQQFMNKTSQQISNDITRLKLGTVKNLDSTVVLTAKKGNNSLEHVYSFDQNGQCNVERVSSTCGSCIEKELKAVLAISQYKWNKINENQYISRFEDKLIIELPVDRKDQYTILYTDWSRTLYDMLTGK